MIEFPSCESCTGFDGIRTEGHFVLHIQLDLHCALASYPAPATALLMAIVWTELVNLWSINKAYTPLGNPLLSTVSLSAWINVWLEVGQIKWLTCNLTDCNC